MLWVGVGIQARQENGGDWRGTTEFGPLLEISSSDAWGGLRRKSNGRLGGGVGSREGEKVLPSLGY